MHIAELRIQNVKRIRAFGIETEADDTVLLTGDNAQGKSSILDAIFLGLQNKGLEDPVRHGSSKASIRLKLQDGPEEEFLVERNITKRTNTLTIKRKDGTPVASPQAFLDSLVGSLAFDPLEFVRMKPKAQASAIRELVGLDTSTLDRKRDEIFAQRTEVNRQLETERAQFKGMEAIEVPAAVEEEEQSAVRLFSELETLKIKITAATKAEETACAAMQQYHEANQELDQLRKAITAAEQKVATAKKRADELGTAAESANSAAPSRAEVDALTKQIEDVDKTNAGIRDRREARAAALRKVEARATKLKAVETLTARTSALTEQLQDIEEQKAEMSRKAKMPVEGMTYDEDGVMIGGMRFDQLSTAEQVKTSAAVAMRGNPKLPIILVREGALLNKENLKAIVDAAKDSHYQLWIEKFQEEPGSAGLHIEDGQVTHVDGKSVKPATADLTLEGTEA